MEEWRPIPGFDGHYEISTAGNVRSVDRIIRLTDEFTRFVPGRLMKLYTPANPKRYIRVDLAKDKMRKTMELHRLLAMTFIPNPDGLPEVDHIDRNHRNNALSNLRWTDVFGNRTNRGHKNNTSGILGMTVKDDKYVVRIKRRGEAYSGVFDTFEDAKKFVETITAQTLRVSSLPCIAPASDAPPSPSTTV